MLARRTPVDVLRATSRGVAAHPLAGTASAPKTASGGLRPWSRHRVGRTAPQPTVAPGKNRPRYDAARRGAVLPQNNCSQAVVDFGNGLIDFANGLNDVGDKALIGAGGVAVAGAAVGSTGLGLPLGLTAEALAGGLAATGGLSKAIGGTVGLIGSGLVAGQTKNGSFTIATAFSAVAAWATVKNPVASFFQDKMVSGASSLVGADKPPKSCPKGGR